MVFVILIRWISIYPVDSAIRLLNNRDQVDNFSELDSKLEGVGLEVLQPDMSSENVVIKPGKANSGLDAEKAINL